MIRRYIRAAIIALLFAAPLLFVGTAYAVTAEKTTDVFLQCDGTSTLKPGNRLECSIHVIGPVSSEIGATLKVSSTCNGDTGFLNNGPNPTYAQDDKTFTVSGCENKASLKSVTFLDLQTGSPLTEGKPADSTIKPPKSGQLSFGPDDCAGKPVDKCVKTSQLVTNVINKLVVIFSLLFGIVATIMFIIAGIIYASSADDPQKVALAKKIILNTVIAIVAYALLFAFMDFIVPGGLLS